MKVNVIFLDGRMVRADPALVDSLAPGVVQGEGVFETMRAREGKIGDLKEHLDRLWKGLKFLNIRPPYPTERLEYYLYRTLKVNGFRQARVRLAVWREKRHVRTAVVCRPFRGHSGDKYRRGFHAVVSDIRRKKTRSSHIKSMDYACFRRAFAQAKNKGFDEAILLNGRQEIVEGSRTNIFFVHQGVLCTPAIHCGALNGITRQQVIRRARREKIPVRMVAAGIRELFRADEAFVTNSLIGVMPLTAVAGRPVGSGKAGPVTQKLLRAYCTNAHSSCPVRGKSV